jgi:large subunit ribosomal protein L24
MPAPKQGTHHGNKLHVKKGDTVMVLSGKNKGATGVVLLALPETQKVVVEGVNIVKKHVKPSAGNTAGGIEERPGALHASKVGLVDPETGKPTRIRKELRDGKKVRIGVSSGKVID